MANFVFAAVSAIILGLMAYAYFNGSTSARLDTLEGQMRDLQSDIKDLQRQPAGQK